MTWSGGNVAWAGSLMVETDKVARVLVTFRAARQTRHSLGLFDAVSVRTALTFLSARWRDQRTSQLVSCAPPSTTTNTTTMGGKIVTVASDVHRWKI